MESGSKRMLCQKLPRDWLPQYAHNLNEDLFGNRWYLLSDSETERLETETIYHQSKSCTVYKFYCTGGAPCTCFVTAGNF